MANKELIKARLKVSHEPVINQLEYTPSLINALNYYNANFTTGDYRKWFEEYFKGREKFSQGNLSDFEFRVGGVLARIKANGNVLSDADEDRLESEYQRVKDLAASKKVSSLKAVAVESTEKVAPKVTAEEKLNAKALAFLGEFNQMVDEFIETKKIPNVAALAKTMGIDGKTGKVIAQVIARPMQELRDLIEGTDKQLTEGWSNVSRPNQKKLLGLYETLMASLNQAKVAAPRKIRKVKEKPAGILVAKMKHKKEDEEYGLKSVSPVNVVGAAEVWVFNTKSRNLQAYFAMEGTALTVKGTKLMNWDTSKSRQRKIRKPETLLATVGQGKRFFNQFINSVKAKDGKVNGRMTDDTVILAAFK